ncbi:MAG: hypothetical protein A2Z12_07355 [Actinobacteria bacterium RBG_16_68_21]|nr:MAG: hypothetical protein A2Z12_07355 [Actinobacteria bacterium RBG_16_68_21]
MRNRDEALLSEILPPEERAVEAVVARYLRVAPAVTRFARSLAGDDGLRVRLGSRTQAEPGEIVMDPGIFQAAYARRAPVTPSEVALASALHEVVHLVATDLEERRALPAEWFPEIDEPLPEDPVPLLDALDRAGGPAAEAMFLAVEDARQEAQNLGVYPGARSVLGDMYRAAVPAAMGKARPLGQFALCCFLAVGGYQDVDALQSSTQPTVTAALEDARSLIDEARRAAGPWEAASAALALLAVARYHGLLTEASTTETHSETEARQDDEREKIDEGVDAVRMITPILRDAESYDATKRTATAAEAERGARGDVDHAGDPATDQILRVSEGPDVYLPTGQSGRLIVSPIPERFARFAADGRTAIAEAARRWQVGQRHISGELYPLFVANQRRGLRSGYDAGDLSPYSALFLGAGLFERMFERRSLPTRRAYAVSLLVDGSASMLQPRALPGGVKAPWAMAAATLGAWTLALLCDELQVEFEVALFNRAFASRVDDTERSYVDRLNGTRGALRRSQGGAADRLTRTVNHYLVKSFDQRWVSAEPTLAGLFWTAAKPAEAATSARRNPEASPPVAMFEKAANVDELNVSHAAERLGRRHTQVRLLVVLADGMTRGSVETLAAAVDAVEHSGTTVLGIGIGDATVEAAYSRSQVCARPEELTRAMIEGVRSALRKSIALSGGDTWWAHEGLLYDESVRRKVHG